MARSHYSMRLNMGNAENREKIISAAVNLSENTCLDRIGADGLARHIGISEEEVIRLFPDCPALSTGIFQWTANKLMEQIEFAALRNKPPLEALEDIFQLHIAFLVNHPSLPPLLLQALSIPGSSMALRDRITELWILTKAISRFCSIWHKKNRKSGPILTRMLQRGFSPV